MYSNVEKPLSPREVLVLSLSLVTSLNIKRRRVSSGGRGRGPAVPCRAVTVVLSIRPVTALSFLAFQNSLGKGVHSSKLKRVRKTHHALKMGGPMIIMNDQDEGLGRRDKGGAADDREQRLPCRFHATGTFSLGVVCCCFR